MKAIAFDTLEFAKKLKAAQFTAEQAETLAAAVAEIIDSRLATKEDLGHLQNGLEEKIARLQYDLEQKIARLQHDLEEKITLTELRLKHDLTLRLGGMLAAAVAVVAALVKLL